MIIAIEISTVVQQYDMHEERWVEVFDPTNPEHYHLDPSPWWAVYVVREDNTVSIIADCYDDATALQLADLLSKRWNVPSRNERFYSEQRLDRLFRGEGLVRR